ncbi:MAG: prepilin peptidase [Rhizobiales bacterium]|nr:prepilin peptidase [Hyphomicrobiales bacterium]
MISLAQSVLYLAFPAAMAGAAVSDLATMTIPNRLSLALVALFMIAAPVYGLTLADIGAHLLIGLTVLAIGIALFARGWIGGGDAKIAAAAALWLGLPQLLPFLSYSALFGGLLTLAVLLFRRQMLPAFALGQGWLMRLHDPRAGVPYGVALAAGALVAFPDTLFVKIASGA